MNGRPPDQPPFPAVLLWTNTSTADVHACLQSLRVPESETIEIWIALPESFDPGELGDQETQPAIKIIPIPDNDSAGEAWNAGLKQIPPDRDVLMLHSGIRFDGFDTVKHLLDSAYSDSGTGIVGCRFIDSEGMTLHAGTYLARDNWKVCQLGEKEEDIGQYRDPQPVEGVSGNCMLIRSDVRNALEGFTPGADPDEAAMDFALRAREAGYAVLCDLGTAVQLATLPVTDTEDTPETSGAEPLLRERWESRLRERLHHPLLWHSLVASHSGYARSSREILRQLVSREVDVRLGSLYGSDYDEPLTGDVRLDQLRRLPKDLTLPQVVYGQGDMFYKNGGAYRIGFTMLEITGLPDEWVRQCNAMDEVWVPSRFNVETFRDSGVIRPIHVIPLGIDPRYYHPEIIAERYSSRYTFLSVFEWSERKGMDILFRAFCKAFGPGDDVALVVKFSSRYGFDLRQYMFDLGLPEASPPIVLLQSNATAHYQMGAVYKGADCFVLASRGEGWGMPILEAMACGLPAIATHWSGQTEFMTDKNSLPVKVEKLVPARAKSPYYKGFEWAQPDEQELADRMRWCYEHPDQARSIGERAAQEAKTSYTWSHTADRILERLDHIGA